MSKGLVAWGLRSSGFLFKVPVGGSEMFVVVLSGWVE